MTRDDTQHVLDLIDGALDDWEVSGDAMRWRPPEAEPVEGGIGLDAMAASIGARVAVRPSRDFAMYFGPTGSPPPTTPRQAVALGYAVVQALHDETAQALEHYGRQIAALSATPEGPIIRDLRLWHDAVEAESEPAEDPRERALRLRQQRNTGPGAPRLDGRRGR